MTSLKIILFLGCMTLAACEVDYDCIWSRCENKTLNQDDVCLKYGKYNVSANLDIGTDCTSEFRKFYCCTPPIPSRRDCKWTTSCHQLSITAEEACQMEYEWSTSGNDVTCDTPEFKIYECCR
ncbi:hypothetical protein Bhyg_09028 [Pseudolycoriella hygida]|uniref:Uncharacterized protein n=1 Tax=Pseudolycoriella hygida TaxID=35572 RepID=A0A9Q0N5S6_9DIPT|nr:hypothetical protein Bhyg_09028 [Pseudolycoriella hygida]